MRRTRSMVMLVSVLTLGLFSLAFAQMMNNQPMHAAMGQNGTASQNATTNMKSPMTGNSVDSLMTTMSQQCTTMLGDLNSMQAANKTMMQEKDIKVLHAQMVRQQQMMQQMRMMLTQQQGEWQNMMSNMHQNGMMQSNGMMGSNGMMNSNGMMSSNNKQPMHANTHH